MTQTQARELRLGPEVTFKHHTVFVEGVAVGEFAEPWKAVAALTEACQKYAAKVIETK